MSFRLSRITLREISMALREPFEISSGLTNNRRILLLELEDADGATAWSECVAGEQPNYSPETIDTAWFAITEWIAPRILGIGIRHPEKIDGLLRRWIRGHPMARASVEMGIWALWAIRERKSLSHLLGGTRRTIATGISIGLQPTPQALVQKARHALAQGYRRVKIKIKPGADIEYIGAIRAALGAKAPLMADANGAYTLKDADHLADLDSFRLLMIEQPLAQDDLRRHAELRDRIDTPICLDESITHIGAVEDMLALRAAQIVNIKAARVGGLAQAKAIHDMCQHNAVPVWCGGMLESGIGRAYNVALASLNNFNLPGDVSPSTRYWQKDIVTPEWSMDLTGHVSVPITTPGIGVQVDSDRVESLTSRKVTVSA